MSGCASPIRPAEANPTFPWSAGFPPADGQIPAVAHAGKDARAPGNAWPRPEPRAQIWSVPGQPGRRGRKRGRVVSPSTSSNTASTSSPTAMSSLAISDEARREARPFLELDLGGVVGEVVGEGRKPPLVDDDEARDGAPATRHPPFEALAETLRAHGRRRQEGAVALRAPRELQHVRAAPVPERAVVRGHPGLGLYRHIHVVRAPFSRGRRSSRPTPSPTGGASRPGSAVPPPRPGAGGRSPRSSSSR